MSEASEGVGGRFPQRCGFCEKSGIWRWRSTQHDRLWRSRAKLYASAWYWNPAIAELGLGLAPGVSATAVINASHMSLGVSAW